MKFLKYLGPGLLVTVGFIDPGNWAANIAAGSSFGIHLIWVITLATIMLIVLQHNAAHLGVVTGLCMSEASTAYLPKFISKFLLISAMGAAVATVFAEILGGAIALNMLFHLPIKIGTGIISLIACILVLTNSYQKIERIIIAFVSLIGIAFIFELGLIDIPWKEAAISAIIPSIPPNSILIIVSLLGAVVMPHNLFLHSEVIQSRKWNLENKKTIEKELKFEFLDTIFSMGIGWAINVSMILVAAMTFYNNHTPVKELQEAYGTLKPLLGNSSALIFAIALLFAGIASSITAAMASGSIFAGMYKKEFDPNDKTSRVGILITFGLAILITLFVSDPFQGLVLSQAVLSIQLPLTIMLLIYLTSSKKVMGKYKNIWWSNAVLALTGLIVIFLNLSLLKSMF